MSMVSIIGCALCGFDAPASAHAWGAFLHAGDSVCEDCQSIDCEQCRECGHFDIVAYVTDGICDYCIMTGVTA